MSARPEARRARALPAATALPAALPAAVPAVPALPAATAAASASAAAHASAAAGTGAGSAGAGSDPIESPFAAVLSTPFPARASLTRVDQVARAVEGGMEQQLGRIALPGDELHRPPALLMAHFEIVAGLESGLPVRRRRRRLGT